MVGCLIKGPTIGCRRNDEAINLFNKALTASSLKSDKKELAIIYQGLADCYDDKQAYRKSIDSFWTDAKKCKNKGSEVGIIVS